MKKIYFGFLIFFLFLWNTAPILFSKNSHKETKKFSAYPSDIDLTTNPGKTRILVGPNILVSRDGDIPHCELMVASNPKDPENLLGAAITYTRPDGSQVCKTYASVDCGYTWTDSAFREQRDFGSGDPQVAFGLHGTAYFSELGWIKDEKGRSRMGLYVYRSEDAGKTWQKPSLLRSCDHPQLVVDQSYGKYAGRVYIGVLYTSKYKDAEVEYTVGVFRSDDDGRTFIGPVDATSGGGKKGINVTNMLILSDGTLFVPYSDFEYKDEKRRTSKFSTFWFVTSSDGGISFSIPTKIHDQYYKDFEKAVNDWKNGDFVSGTFPEYAIDLYSKAYRDRLYATWNDYRFGSTRILYSFSSDRGKTWSQPKQVNPQIPDWASQYQPMIAVNNQGVVGIMWFDTRGSKQQDQYHLYFTASVDGGESFLPPVQVSSESSFPVNKGNLTPSASSQGTNKSISVSIWSPFNHFPQGGDYMGMTVDSNGIFHPFWTDSRSGTFQVWTSQIRINIKEEKEKSKEKAFNKKIKTSLNGKVGFIFDPVTYDPKTQVMLVPIRLKNVSGEAFFGPFSLKVKSLSDPGYVGHEEWISIPQILNASNGKNGVDAEFDYSSSLRDFESLEPGAVSEAIRWKIMCPMPTLTSFYIEIEVTGFVYQKE